MVNPVVALGVFLVVAAACAVLLWPGRGLLWRIRHLSGMSERILVEDALKHLWDCEQRRHSCTLHSVAGALEVSTPRAADVLGRLEELELVTSSGGQYRLTADGRADALQVIRAHRIVESYLSERTGVEAAAWHREAERREHELTPEEVDELSARLGHPRYDPHGDPIPTTGGDIRPPEGRPLADLEVGQAAIVVHVEDEPEPVYRRLVAEALVPGVQVQVLESTGGAVRFQADGRDVELPPVVAANVSVRPVESSQLDEPADRLSSLEPGQEGCVTGFSPACRGEQRRRLLDLGLIPGTVVKAELRAPGGDPTGYRIRGAVIGLRREQADLIQIEHARKGAAA